MIGRFTSSPTSRIVFGDNIGTLEFSDQTIKFEGNSNESATILFDFVVKQFDEHLRNLIAAEREACAKLCESCHWEMMPKEVAGAIRARSKHDTNK